MQQALDPNLELYHFSGHVSVPFPNIFPSRKPIKTDQGGVIKQSSTRRGVTEITYGMPNPTQFRLNQREILEEITAIAPRLRFPDVAEEPVPEVVFKIRGIREETPDEFEDIDVFQGNEEVFYRQIAKGNRTPSLRRMFQLPLRNPYHMAKNGLVLHGMVQPKDPVFRRLRSVLSNDWIGVGNERGCRKGWMELEAYGTPLQRRLSRDKWWQDLAVPHPISDTIDHRIVKAQIYILDKRNDLFAV